MERKLRKLKKYSTQNNNKITTSRSQTSKHKKKIYEKVIQKI